MKQIVNKYVVSSINRCSKNQLLQKQNIIPRKELQLDQRRITSNMLYN